MALIVVSQSFWTSYERDTLVEWKVFDSSCLILRSTRMSRINIIRTSRKTNNKARSLLPIVSAWKTIGTSLPSPGSSFPRERRCGDEGSSVLADLKISDDETKQCHQLAQTTSRKAYPSQMDLHFQPKLHLPHP